MNYQASNPKSLSETPERLSETKTRSGSPAAAAKKRAAAKKQAAEVLTSCTNPQLNCSICAGISRKCRGGERFTHYQTLYQSLPELRASERDICVSVVCQITWNHVNQTRACSKSVLGGKIRPVTPLLFVSTTVLPALRRHFALKFWTN